MKDQGFEDFLYRRHYKQRTVELFRLYRQRLHDWLDQENIEIQNCSYSDLLAYIKYMREQGQKIRNIVSQLSAFRQYFDYLKQQRVITMNPAKTIFLRGYKQRIPHDILSRETLQEIYDGCPDTGLIQKRDKLMLSFVIYQGLFKNEVLNIEPGDLNLLKGTAFIRGNGNTRARTLNLEPHQVLPLQEYITTVRPVLVKEKGTDSPYLFVSKGKCINAENSLYELLEVLKKKHSNLKNFLHIRISLISHWIGEKNIREVQHLAGHKTIVGTEMYKSVDLKDLQDSLVKFHPLNQ
ncbi:MAG: tyrosine-type recombinase/integrase [Bacteroidota bacterium]